MSFIHGRALQLQHYICGDIKLGAVIPDAPDGFANLVISANTLTEFQHLVPPPKSATPQVAAQAIAQFKDLLDTGGCALNAKGAAHHCDGFITYKEEGGGHKAIGVDIKDEQATTTTGGTLAAEYSKGIYSEQKVCRCEKMISIRPRIGGRLRDHKFISRMLQKLADVDQSAVKDENDDTDLSSLFASGDEEGAESVMKYDLIPPHELPVTVAHEEVVHAVNTMLVPYTSKFWLSDGHSIIPCYEYFYQNAAGYIKDLLAAKRREARRK